ncbi:MAG: bifunctional hydroxymethylpyrimidine kinase/phosphomethylpyrimidine kinase [Lachnospiraceae bacterium]|nr:bifunctional hydroxymethylpyrimidine kinase/phosphomethylpyrimidine kinase [Lachnospiraceae bacterium]
MENSKEVMLINDLPGYGKVALAAMVPLLSRMGHYTFQLPTAVVSNTLDYGKFRIQDMTDYMRDTLKVWDELGFDPDCICTGFVLSEEQVEIIGNYIRSRSRDKERLVMVDPIMGDGGSLYNGIGMDRVEAMRKLVSYSDVMVPNMTEAAFLTGIRPGTEEGNAAQIRELIDGLRALSGKSVVITSVMDRERDAHMVCGYDHVSQEYFEVPFEYLPVRVPGSGDIFSAMMTGELLAGRTLREGVEKAVRVLAKLIGENQGHLKGYKGIQVEQYWDVLAEV